jgi:hypothetical protein
VPEAVGIFSGRTLEKAKRVVEAAERDPEFRLVVEEMDRTSNVDRAFREVTRPRVDGDAEGRPHSDLPRQAELLRRVTEELTAGAPAVAVRALGAVGALRHAELLARAGDALLGRAQAVREAARKGGPT